MSRGRFLNQAIDVGKPQLSLADRVVSRMFFEKHEIWSLKLSCDFFADIYT